jgi:GNAT superfamily N-acetyltransferase
VRPGDHDPWAELFRAYAQTRRPPLDPKAIDVMWDRLHDRKHPVHALVVRQTYGGPPVGLAHYRTVGRTASAAPGCIVDDFFVDTAARGTGAASAMVAHLRRVAAAQRWGAVRWLAAADNPTRTIGRRRSA